MGYPFFMVYREASFHQHLFRQSHGIKPDGQPRTVFSLVVRAVRGGLQVVVEEFLVTFIKLIPVGAAQQRNHLRFFQRQ